MKINQVSKNKRLFQGMGIGYFICLLTHIIAALIPMYVVFPFAERFFGHTHGPQCAAHGHSAGLLSHIMGDVLILTMIIIPVALLTFFGHKLVKYVRCRCGAVHEDDPCETCPHKKY